MRFKAGVSVVGLQPQIALALSVAESVYEDYDTELVVTSCNDGQHSYSSLHWSGNAADIRTKSLPKELWHSVHSQLQEALGRDYDVVLESDHIHVEYQPKSPL